MTLIDHPPPECCRPDLSAPGSSLPTHPGAFDPGAFDPGAFDPGALADDDLLAEIVSIEALQRRLDAHRLALLGETAARAVCERQSGLTVKSWLGHECRLSAPTAAKQTATAVKLRRVLPRIAGALAAGSITFDHAALITRLCVPRVETIVVELQDRMVELAQVQRFEAWAHDVRGLISLADQDGPDPLGEPVNRLRMTDGLDGELHLDVDLVGSNAAKVRAAIRAEAQRRYRAHLRTTCGHEAGGEDAGGADVDCVRCAGAGCDNEEALAGFPGRAELYAEALAELISRGVLSAPGAGSPVTDVTLVVQASGPLGAHTPDGVRLQDGTTRELLCDAVFHVVVVDALGVPVDQGRASRLFRASQRRNIMIRDGGCGHPGCDAPWEWCQIHHVQEWAAGGPTDQRNGIPVCARHHSLWHSRGWSVALDPETHLLDQGFVITTPDHRTLRSQRHGRQRPLVVQLGLEARA